MMEHRNRRPGYIHQGRWFQRRKTKERCYACGFMVWDIFRHKTFHCMAKFRNCYTCGRLGHYSRTCYQKPSDLRTWRSFKNCKCVCGHQKANTDNNIPNSSEVAIAPKIETSDKAIMCAPEVCDMNIETLPVKHFQNVKHKGITCDITEPNNVEISRLQAVNSDLQAELQKERELVKELKQKLEVAKKLMDDFRNEAELRDQSDIKTVHVDNITSHVKSDVCLESQPTNETLLLPKYKGRWPEVRYEGHIKVIVHADNRETRMEVQKILVSTGNKAWPRYELRMSDTVSDLCRLLYLRFKQQKAIKDMIFVYSAKPLSDKAPRFLVEKNTHIGTLPVVNGQVKLLLDFADYD